MQKKTQNHQFSERLRELMVQRGYSSHNSSSGVSPSAITKALGCYTEMALRYLDGRSIPSPENTLKLSEWLKVEPGYLMFGEQGYKNPNQDKGLIKIDATFLDYTLNRIVPILKKRENGSEFIEFYMSILIDLSQMEISTEHLKKVFDLTLKSSLFYEMDPHCGSNDNGKSRKIPRKIAS